MKKSSIILFCLRLVLYFSVIFLIFIHPGISVSFDRAGIIQWLVIIPLMAVIAFLPKFLVKSIVRQVIILLVLIASPLIAGVGITGAIQLVAVGIISSTLTILLFRCPPVFARFAKIAFLEPFFFAWVCLRLLSLSRSGEEIAGQSAALTQFILVWAAVVFLFHSIIIYLCLYPKSRAGVWKEGAAFSSGALAVMFALLFVLPPDFIRNTVIENLIPERIPQRLPESDADRGLPARGSGRRTLPGGEGGRGELRGISEHDWPGRGGDESRQYMVMIVASAAEPVYMGDSFRGLLDPVHGFLLSPAEPLNELARQRLFITWSGNEGDFTFGRRRREVFSLSTLSQKFLPYRPVSIVPTILNENSGPLRYIHQVVSNMHNGDPLMLVNMPTRYFTDREKSALAHYLDIQLEAGDRVEFENYLNNALRSWRTNRREIIRGDPYLAEIFSAGSYGWEDLGIPGIGGNEYIETIFALLTSFSGYQYNLLNEEDHSIAALKDFLFRYKEGDCTEFSNSLALLGRLAGIPSRVVTGYLAAEGLQTPAHYRGIAALRSRIPVLQQFPFENLFMVTNIHRHSWTQFYIPDYGWLDFEATSFSIPPVGMGDFNNWDVVIPLLDDNRTFSQVRRFPWQAAGRAVIALVIAALIGAYVLRYGRELVLYLGSRHCGREGARSLYLLLLARLAADGRPIKPASKTAHEYSQLFSGNSAETRRNEADEENPRFRAFADIYSEIRWRNLENETDINERFLMLKNEYQNILNSTRRRGIHHFIKRILSLRGLAYL